LQDFHFWIRYVLGMQESNDIQIPDVIPVMTLEDTVLFPHSVMPLFIFEPRYRKMLKDVLQTHRLFAIFNESNLEDAEDHEEPPSVMGTVGVVRAAHQNPDGTSNLALQGITRVRLVEIVQESPYRLIRVAPCPDASVEECQISGIRQQILHLIDEHPHLTQGLPKEYLKFIQSLDRPGPFIDVASHSLCHDSRLKQQLLETLSLDKRFGLLFSFLTSQCNKYELFKELQGRTRDEEIDLN